MKKVINYLLLSAIMVTFLPYSALAETTNIGVKITGETSIEVVTTISTDITVDLTTGKTTPTYMEIQNNSTVPVSAKITNIKATSEGAPSTFVKSEDVNWESLSKADTKKYVNFNILGEGQNVSSKDILPNTEIDLGTLNAQTSLGYDAKTFEINANFGRNWDSGDKNFTYQIETVYTQTDEGTMEVLCTANTEKVNALVFESDEFFESGEIFKSYKSEKVGLLASEAGKYTPGVIYTCNLGDGERIFYVLEESGNNVSLILGTNLGTDIQWISKDDYISAGGVIADDADDTINSGGVTNEYGPITANNALKERTKSWTRLMSNKITLPTYNQLMDVVTNNNDSTPTWLFSFTDNNNAGFGYWTSTPTSANYLAGIMGYDGIPYVDYVITGKLGIRPVITVLKIQLG